MPGVFVVLSADVDRRLVALARRLDLTIHDVAAGLLSDALIEVEPKTTPGAAIEDDRKAE